MDALQRWLARRRASGILAGFVLPAYVVAASVAVALPVVAAIRDGLAPGLRDGCALHVGAALSGSAAVFSDQVAPGCSNLSVGAAREAILWDVPFVLVYASLGSILTWWMWPRAWRIARVRRRRWIALLPAFAGAFDLVENALVVAGLRDGPSLEDGFARAASVAGWWKWSLVVLSSLVGVACVCGAVGNLRARRRLPPPPAPRSPRPVQDEIGICLSGAGVRSAAFALGALRALDRRKLLRSARWIAAVSGGAYAAGAWFIGRGSAAEASAVRPQPRDGVDGLLDPPGEPDLFAYLVAHRRYLATGRGGLPGTVVTAAVLVAFNVFVLATVVCLVAWPLGRLAATWAVQPSLRAFEYATVATQSLDVPGRLWLPGLAGVALAAGAWIVALFLWDPARTRVLRVGGFFAAGGTALLGLLVAAPVAMAETPKLFERLHDNPLWGAGVVTAVVAAALAGAVARLARKPSSRASARLGALLLVLLALSFAGRVATDAAYDDGWFAWSPARYAVVLGAFCVFYALANAQSWSSFRLRYLRLRSTFATTQRRARAAAGAPGYAGVFPLSLEHEPEWPEYRGRPGPELVVCAAERSGDGTVPVTFSPHDVAHLDGLRRPGRWGPRLGTVSAAMALSGTAFTSGLGPQSPALNALLAASNVRLGAWMPNPRYATGRPLPRPRLNYLLKEMLGVHDADDPYVYVGGGGESLGLLELVRRRVRWIVCVDGSDSFDALHEAMLVARAEFGAEIVIDVDPLRPRDGRLPETALATGVVRYHACGGAGPDGCPTGLLFYGRAVLAADSPFNALSFSLRDGIRPRHPYGRSLPEDELMNLVRLGEAVGRGLALDYERFGPPP